MFEQYLLDVFVYGALGYLSFRYAEMILTGQFSRRGLVLTIWIILYTAGSLVGRFGLDYAPMGENSVYGGFLHILPGALLLLCLQKNISLPTGRGSYLPWLVLLPVGRCCASP